jgi:FkbM family methyltransferase
LQGTIVVISLFESKRSVPVASTETPIAHPKFPGYDERGEASRLAASQKRNHERRIVPLSNTELMVETLRGFHMVVPSWNLDVAIGIVRDGIIEPWTNDVFTALLKPGHNVINVGANFGYYSLLAAQRIGGTGSVYAVEANPIVFPYLVKSIFYAGFTGIVRAFNCAAVAPDSHDQVLEFQSNPQFVGGGNLFGRQEKPKAHILDCVWDQNTILSTLGPNREFLPKGIACGVETVGKQVDSIVDADQKFDVMLIDAEGSESFVIAGAQEVIRRSPNLQIIVEWDPRSHDDENRRPYIDAMWDLLLDEQGYTPYRICHEGYRGLGRLPELTELNRESLFNVPHSDILLLRNNR